MRDDLIAYLAEDSEFEEDGPIGLATFSGHVEDGADLDAPWPGIRSVPLDPAVRWASERADRVIVRLSGFDQEFSAGRVAVNLPPLPDGLVLRRRRVAGWEFLDRTSQDDEIEWDVNVDVDTFALAVGAHLGLTPLWPDIRSALRSDPRVIDVAAENMKLPITVSNGAGTAGKHTQVATVRVRGRTVEDAGRAACGLLAEIAAAVGWQGRRGHAPTFAQAGAYPTGSRAAGANAGFRDGQRR